MYKKVTPIILLIVLTILLAFFAFTLRQEGFDFNWKIIKMIRFPEIVMLIVGTLGSVLATYALHLLTKNKIADVGIIGMTGINFLLLTIIYALVSLQLFNQIKNYVLPIAYLAGSLLVLGLIFLLTYKFHDSSEQIILIGIVFTLTISAFTQMILSTLPNAKQVYLSKFSIGFLASGATILTEISSFFAYGMLVLALLLIVIFGKKIIIMYSDIDKALALGINIKRLRLVLFLIIALASATSFIALGAIAFIGFIATNIVYLFWKRVGLWQLIFAFIAGLALMFGVYLLKNTIINSSIPIGIVTNIIAIPYLVFVLWKGEKNDR